MAVINVVVFDYLEREIDPNRFVNTFCCEASRSRMKTQTRECLFSRAGSSKRPLNAAGSFPLAQLRPDKRSAGT